MISVKITYSSKTPSSLKFDFLYEDKPFLHITCTQTMGAENAFPGMLEGSKTLTSDPGLPAANLFFTKHLQVAQETSKLPGVETTVSSSFETELTEIPNASWLIRVHYLIEKEKDEAKSTAEAGGGGAADTANTQLAFTVAAITPPTEAPEAPSGTYSQTGTPEWMPSTSEIPAPAEAPTAAEPSVISFDAASGFIQRSFLESFGPGGTHSEILQTYGDFNIRESKSEQGLKISFSYALLGTPGVRNNDAKPIRITLPEEGMEESQLKSLLSATKDAFLTKEFLSKTMRAITGWQLSIEQKTCERTGSTRNAYTKDSCFDINLVMLNALLSEKLKGDFLLHRASIDKALTTLPLSEFSGYQDGKLAIKTHALINALCQRAIQIAVEYGTNKAGGDLTDDAKEQIRQILTTDSPGTTPTVSALFARGPEAALPPIPEPQVKPKEEEEEKPGELSV